MWLDEADGFAELFRGYLPYYLLVALPIFIIMSPVNPVAASHEFSVYRMQQYDLHSVPHGCRSAGVHLEGRSLSAWSTARHCVVARLQDISIDQFMEIKSKAGALLLVLPKNITTLNDKDREHIQLLESAMGHQDVPIPVYLVEWSPQVEVILDDLQGSFITDDKSGTALEALMTTASANGYQIVIGGGAPQTMEARAVSLHGRLAGRGDAPTIIVAAHYDATALAPELAWGGDSNASGATVLLELARIFSRLYASSATRASPSLLFLLTGTGHRLNYFSAKKWLEDQLDSSDGTLLQDVSFAMCLESVSSGEELTLHVSKPPRPESAAGQLRARLGAPALHKKINLADEHLAWQHERFSIRRMTAFTVSALKSHKDASRSSLLDGWSALRADALVSNARRLAHALAAHIYNLTDDTVLQDQLYADALEVDEEFVKSTYAWLAGQPRSAHVLASSAAAASALQRLLARFLGDAVLTTHVPDKREPEFALYTPTKAVLNVYSVKPAVFDLILTLAIVVYLALIYFLITLFPVFYRELTRVSQDKTKTH